MSNIVLFDSKEKCCGCTACYNVCPKDAIAMQEDEAGFIYPVIDKDKCVECGACKKVCRYQNFEESEGAIATYAAARLNKERIKKSTSGGIFAVIAEKILEDGGCVFGTREYIEPKNGDMVISHTKIETVADLDKITGSKYVQSFIGDTYKDVKKELLGGRKVLFSGTACQIAGLKGYLIKEYENLYTIDIVCHGTPNVRFFNDHIKELEISNNAKVKEYIFRNKEHSWTPNAKVTFEYIDGKIENRLYEPSELSYYSIFMDAYSYRENCYSCKYTNNKRPADITLADYWGVVDLHPEFMDTNGGKLSKTDGVSALIINNKKGEELLSLIDGEIVKYSSEFKKVASRNPQLRTPCKRTKVRDRLVEIYSKHGYSSAVKYYTKIKNRHNRYISLKNVIKKLIGKK